MKYCVNIRALSINQSYRFYNRHFLLSLSHREYMNNLKKLLTEAWGDNDIIADKCQLNVTFYLDNYKDVDLDNLLKGFIDGLKGNCIVDDKLIFNICATKVLGALENCIEFEIIPEINDTEFV